MEKTKIRSFKDLFAWQKGHRLVLMIYEVTKIFPKDEQFGLVSQMRRCAVSITSNIAEGFSRKTYKDKSQFYSIALGSVTELQNQIQIAHDVGLITVETFTALDLLSIEVHKIINGLLLSSKNIIRT
jgi:four helix bundle protein